MKKRMPMVFEVKRDEEVGDMIEACMKKHDYKVPKHAAAHLIRLGNAAEAHLIRLGDAMEAENDKTD